MTQSARVVAIAALPLLIATTPSLAAGRAMADVLVQWGESDGTESGPVTSMSATCRCRLDKEQR